jgi:hypothetical protein
LTLLVSSLKPDNSKDELVSPLIDNASPKWLRIQQRMLKMMVIADDRHFIYQNEDDLVDFIASEMQKEGLDLNNEENLDSYLNTKFM